LGEVVDLLTVGTGFREFEIDGKYLLLRLSIGQTQEFFNPFEKALFMGDQIQGNQYHTASCRSNLDKKSRKIYKSEKNKNY